MFNKRVKLPPKLTTLDLRNGNLNVDLPDSVVKLSINCKKTDLKFPPGLKKLYWRTEAKEMSNLPPTLESFTLIGGHECAILDLPPHLERLHINKKIGKLPPLPSTLTHFSITDWDNLQTLKLQLLPRLTHLTIQGLFMKDVRPEYLPPNITHLTINLGYCEEKLDLRSFPLVFLDTTTGGDLSFFPKSLRTMKVRSLNTTIDAVWPPRVEVLGIEAGRITHLPHTISKFHVGLRGLQASYPVYANAFSPLPDIPEGIEELLVGPHYWYPIPSLPSTLRVLHVFNGRYDPLPPLPPALEEFVFGSGAEVLSSELKAAVRQATSALPPTLTKLILSYTMHDQVLTYLPPNLRELEVFTNSPLPPLPLTLESMILKYENTLSPRKLEYFDTHHFARD